MKRLFILIELISVCFLLNGCYVSTPKRLNYWRFVIDAGHGGYDSGAINNRFGVIEKEINLDVAKRLADKLASEGAFVRLTRDGDYYVSLFERAKIAKDFNSDRFISIHHNSSENSSVNGTEVWIYEKAGIVSEDLANQIYLELISEFRLLPRGVKRSNSLILLQYLYEYNIPAVITEAYFISNDEWAVKSLRAEYREREASAIFRGIINHSSRYSYSQRDR